MEETNICSISICVIIIVAILFILFVIPIKRIGFVKFLYYLQEMNPVVKRIINKYLYYCYKNNIKYWFSKVEIINKDKIPRLDWYLDSSFKGINSLNYLDQYSDDVRALLSHNDDMIKEEYRWFRAKFTNEYYFNPEYSPYPRYKIYKKDNYVNIKTDAIADSWIYLTSNQKFPLSYVLDFDLILHSEMEETLQLCFCSQSLAKRFRFILDYNKYIRFEVVDKGFFSPEWRKLNKPAFIPLHKKVNIRLEVIYNTFAIYFDDIFQMAVRIKDYKPEKGFWYIIFWNGKTENKSMNIEIMNIKILLEKK